MTGAVLQELLMVAGLVLAIVAALDLLGQAMRWHRNRGRK